MKAFSVIGMHHSGKTTAVENLIKYIKKQGHSVSSIKDIHQEDFTMERPGSNSHRHLLASNTCVFARGKKETYLIWNRQLRFKEMLSHINTDWLVIEGLSDIALPKIIAAKNLADIEQQFDESIFAITGPFSEKEKIYKGVPILNAISDISKLGELVLKKVFKILPMANEGYCGHCGLDCYEMVSKILNGERKRTDCGINTSQEISIKFQGTEIEINEWVKDLSMDLVIALCKNLKGYKPGDDIEIMIRER